MCVAVYEFLTALLAFELALPEEEILKHVRSVKKRGLLHVIAQAPFRQGRDVVVS